MRGLSAANEGNQHQDNPPLPRIDIQQDNWMPEDLVSLYQIGTNVGLKHRMTASVARCIVSSGRFPGRTEAAIKRARRFRLLFGLVTLSFCRPSICPPSKLADTPSVTKRLSLKLAVFDDVDNAETENVIGTSDRIPHQARRAEPGIVGSQSHSWPNCLIISLALVRTFSSFSPLGKFVISRAEGVGLEIGTME